MTNTRSVLASRVSFNLLTQDADGVRFDRSHEFDELDDMRDLLENAVFASSRCLLLGESRFLKKVSECPFMILTGHAPLNSGLQFPSSDPVPPHTAMRRYAMFSAARHGPEG
jgi:hypothetical protein